MKRFLSIGFSLVIALSGFFFCGFSSGGGQAYAEDARYSSDVKLFSRGGVAYQDVTENISYSYRVIDEYYNPRSLPSYLSDGAGVCAVSAGGVALGYYDWDYDNLIPNHTKYNLWGYEFYGSQGAGVTAMFSDLYTRMGTTSAGTTITGYLDGMESYVEDKNLSIDQTSAMSNGSLNMATYKAALSSGKLMSVFFSGFAVMPFSCLTVNNGYDTIVQSVFTGNHVMMAYGYLHIKYYNSSDVLVHELQLLTVNAALHDPIICYVNLAQYGTVDAAYITEIY